MGGRLQLILLVALAAAFLHVPAASAGSGLAGNPCVGDDTEAGATMISLNNQGSEPFMQPNVPPEGKSIITSWRVQVGAGIGPLQQQLVVSHQVGEEEDLRVAESAVETVVAGSNEFASRIPVSAYDHIGLRGPVETLICHKEMNIAGRVAGDWANGENRHFEALVGIGVPVVARVEPDQDNDGYGDETQDGCPASSALQTPCPLLTVSARPKVKPHAVLIRVTASNESAVQVLGQVRWQEKRPGGGGKLRTFGLGEKAPRMIAGGGTGVFRLRLWNAITRHLDQLPPKQSLRLKVRVGVTDVFGAVIVKTLNVRLHGQAQS
jgi:hypothetical protein